MKEFYQHAYSEERATFALDAYFEVMRKRAAAQSGLIELHLDPADINVLDFGCGYGMLLDVLQQKGASTAGFDYDPACLDRVRKRHSVIEGIEDLSSFADDTWDLICLSHVLEHLPRPAEFLGQAYRKSRWLFIEVPAYDYRIPDQFKDTEGHLWYFTIRALENVVRAAGWEIVEAHGAGPNQHFFWKNDIIRSISRRVLRTLIQDWFFNQYDRKGPDGVWIRLLARKPGLN